jgi:threonine/homoserine/homoserine lactone efflux protein
MTLETWLAFVAASTILVVIPGPTVLLVVSYALGQGWRAALPMAVGVALVRRMGGMPPSSAEHCHECAM